MAVGSSSVPSHRLGPMTKPLPFTESRVRRAIAAVRKEGLPVSAVTVHVDGSVTVHQGGAGVALPANMPQHDAVSKWADTDG
jgi:hypothetical protein